MTSTPQNDALAKALAEIQAMSDRFTEARARKEADPRRNALLDMLPALEPRIYHGFTGRQQVFADLMSPNSKRRLRIKRLVLARECQLSGRYHQAQTLLGEAAAIRYVEKSVLPVEFPEVTLDAATDAFCAHLTARYADSVRNPSVHTQAAE